MIYSHAAVLVRWVASSYKGHALGSVQLPNYVIFMISAHEKLNARSDQHFELVACGNAHGTHAVVVLFSFLSPLAATMLFVHLPVPSLWTGRATPSD